jgi:DAACS family dicarboxylate/amino acid:cation (Na+ or H+) symporter
MSSSRAPAGCGPASLLQEYGGAAQEQIATHARSRDHADVRVEMFMPRNLFGAFSAMTAAASGRAAAHPVRHPRRRGRHQAVAGPTRQLRSGLGLVNELMTGIVHFALAIAPYAVPAMIYSAIVKIGWDIVVALGVFVAGCVFVLLLHLFGTMSLWLRFLAKRNPLKTFRLMRPVLATAFSTSSSAASLPTALAVAREQLGVRARGGIRAVDRHDHEPLGFGVVRGLRHPVHRAGVRD